jgi:hypothetical protein
MMYNNFIRKANAEEIAIYNKVEDLMTDEMYDLITEEDLDDILENRIVNPEILEWIETAGLTVEDICTWYFID